MHILAYKHIIYCKHGIVKIYMSEVSKIRGLTEWSTKL
jgi:hypothetical protein